MKTLIGHLAQFSCFASQGELLCTQGLNYVLQNASACEAFRKQFLTPNGIAVENQLAWRAEVRLAEDRGRPDLEACTTDGKPVVMIEGKLGAPLGESQLLSYAGDLQKRSAAGLLLILVPRYRIEEARATSFKAFGLQRDGLGHSEDTRSVPVMVRVASWDELLTALLKVPSDSTTSDVAQLLELYRALTGEIIEPPLNPEDWFDREAQYRILVDRATRRVTPQNGLLPMAWERERGSPPGPGDSDSEALDEPVLGSARDEAASYGYHRRYVCRPTEFDKPSCFSVGVRAPFPGSATPIWLRFHRDTGMFLKISQRLTASEVAQRIVVHRRHLWMPLDLPPNETDGELIVRSLVAQIEHIVALAYS
jgi:hypothetical protein